MAIKLITAIAFLFVCTISAYPEIRLLWEFSQLNKTIFEVDYPDLYVNYGKHYLEDPSSQASETMQDSTDLKVVNGQQKNQTNSTVEVSKQDNLTNSSSKIGKTQNLVRSIINRFINIASKIPAYIQEVVYGDKIQYGPSFDNNQDKSFIAEFMFQHQIKQLTRVNFDANMLLPGTIIEMVDPLNFAEGMAVIKDNYENKNPLKVKIAHGINLKATLTITENNKNELNAKIAEFQKANYNCLNSQPISLYIESFKHIEHILRKLGLSSNIYKRLQIGSSFSRDIKMQKKIVIVLHQNLFSVALDFTNDIRKNENKTLFDLFYSNPTASLAEKFKRSIKDQNPLQFISQTNYGRLLVLTLTDNKHTQALIDQMLNCFSMQRMVNEVCFNKAMRDISSTPTLRYYFAGVDETSPIEKNCFFCRETVNFQKIFFSFNASTIDYLRPLSGRARNFLEEKFSQVERLFFYEEKLQSEKQQEIELKVASLGESTSIQGYLLYSLGPDPTKHPFNATHPGTFQIGSMVGNKPFELNLIARSIPKKRYQSDPSIYGLKFFFLKNKPIYSIQAEFALLINGQEKIRHIIGNSRSDTQFKGVRIVVDPNNFKNVRLEQD